MATYVLDRPNLRADCELDIPNDALLGQLGTPLSGTRSVVELDGYDETGTVGRNLRFVRVGLNAANELRPFVYNLLHFGTITASKRFLRGQTEERKASYVRMILADPAIQVSQYTFTADDQIDVLRQFVLLECKGLFRRREPIVLALQQHNERAALESIADYLRRYERSPFWLESFVKSYGFRMVVADLIHSSKVLRNPKFSDYQVLSYVDGGFPFVFWWQHFLSSVSPGSRFSGDRTPVFGITKGDEYYPVISMAGNFAYITNTVPGMIYPHNIIELPRMSKTDLNQFYEEYSTRVSRPTFLKRTLFIGDIPPALQYTIPFILHRNSGYRHIYEAFRLEPSSSLRRFYRDLGYYPQNDVVIVGKIGTKEEKNLYDECGRETQLTQMTAQSVMPDYGNLAAEIEQEASRSNLTQQQVSNVSQSISRSLQVIERWSRKASIY